MHLKSSTAQNAIDPQIERLIEREVFVSLLFEGKCIRQLLDLFGSFSSAWDSCWWQLLAFITMFVKNLRFVKSFLIFTNFFNF